ncbi:MFS transporter [Xylanibacillus composti]|uniref:MFS transporter n=1 Tax=Xylanibacillus composti TaxID=1572762 RepID=A0A8J4M0T2_9BACL|nr:MFS transporter [Xylanibacillus composti]
MSQSTHEHYDSPGTPAAPPQAGSKQWIGLAVLALPTLLLALDISVLYIALPHLGADLNPGSSQMLWIMDIYGFMIAGFLVTMGTLGDRIGRRKLLMIGASCFGIASILAAFSVSAEMLIVTRALLGIAGATLMPSTLSLISNMFRNPNQRSVAIGVWMSCFMVGTIIGPLVGGIMLEFFWWGSVFLLGVPVMVLLLVLAPFLLPEYRDTQAGRIDLVSVVLSLITMLPIIYGIKELAKYGWQILPVATIVTGLLFGLLFVRRQRKLTDPLVDVSLFRNSAFGASLGIMLLGGISMGGVFLFVTQYLQMVEGLSPLRAGLWLIPQALGMIAGSMLAPALTRHIRPAYVIAGGLLIAAIGLLMLTQVEAAGSLALLVTGFVIASFGFGPQGVLVTDLVVSSAPPEKTGSASAMSETSAELGMALGVAVMGSIGTAVYRAQVGENMPQGLPGDISEAARDTLAGAWNAAEHLPQDVGTQLLGSAQSAFTDGLNTVAGVGTVCVIVFALLAVFLLKQVRPAGDGQPARDA